MDEPEMEDRDPGEIWQRPSEGGKSSRRFMKIGIAIVAIIVVTALLFLVYYIFFIPHFEISDPEWTITLFGDADFTVNVRNVGYVTATTSLVCEIEMWNGTVFSNSQEITLSSGEERVYEVIVDIPLSRITDLVNATGRCYLE